MTEKDFIKIIEEYVEYKKMHPYWHCNYRNPLKTKLILERINK